MKGIAKRKQGVFFRIIGILLIVDTLCLIALIGWGFLKSLQSVDGYLLSGASETSLPKIAEITFSNYEAAFSSLRYGKTYLGEMFLNSTVYALLVALVSTLMPCVVGYLTATYKMWFNKVVAFIIYFTMVFQVYGSMPSMIMVMDTLGFRNTWHGIVIMKASFLSGGYLFFHGTFSGMSKEYAEAAKIDGATQLQLMFKIAFPLAKTIIFVQFVSSFITAWNDYQTPMIYLSNNPTAAYGLFMFTQSTNSYEDYLIYKLAGFMLLLIPTFTVFMFMRKYLLGEVTEGGVKE